MGDTWRVFSSIASQEMSHLETECDGLIDAYLEAHPDSPDTFGELSAGNAPKEKEIRAAYEKRGLPFGDELRVALGACRSSMTIERPGRLDTDPLQVSVLRHVLLRAGDEAWVLLDDYPLRPAREVLAELETKPSAPGFGAKAEGGARGAPRPANGVALLKAEESVRRILDTLEVAQHNLDLQIDLRRKLGTASVMVKRYVTLLINQGALPDATAAKALKASEPEVAGARAELEAVIRQIRPSEYREVAAAGAYDGDASDEPAEE